MDLALPAFINYLTNQVLVELNGALSNPSNWDEWDRFRKFLDTILTKSRRGRKKTEPLARAGDIKAAVIRSLELTDQPMRLRDIHAACEEHLGKSVRYETVKDCVHKHSRGPSPLFMRVGRGRYVSYRPVDEVAYGLQA